MTKWQTPASFLVVSNCVTLLNNQIRILKNPIWPKSWESVKNLWSFRKIQLAICFFNSINGTFFMPYLVRDCVRCGVKKTQMMLKGSINLDGNKHELFVECSSCGSGSIYTGKVSYDFYTKGNINLDYEGQYIDHVPNIVNPILPEKNSDIPERVSDLFMQAAACRRYGLNEAAGAMFRKTLDVATKWIYKTDSRLADKNPANALANRIKALGQIGVLDQEVVDISDVAIVDGNDAAHDEDPYTSAEAEALEELTADILDRVFIRPAKISRMRDRQIAAGQRKQEA
jgi:hypothetical protein